MARKALILFALVALVACGSRQPADFVTVSDGHFERGGTPYYYIGTNFWYGAILGSEGQGGNRQRLCEELDAMKEAGIDNLRILVGDDYCCDPAQEEQGLNSVFLCDSTTMGIIRESIGKIYE